MHGRNVDKDGSAGYLQHDVHLSDGEHEQDSPQRAVAEHLATEVRIHRRKFKQVLGN